MSKKHLTVFVTAIVCALCAILALALSVGSDAPPERDGDAQAASKTALDPYCMLLTGSDEAAGLCDVMMLISFEPSKDRIFVLQIPRDTYAEYTEASYKKLNGAKNSLGGEGLCRFLSDSLGVAIDGYLSIDLDAFGDIVDAVGGVEIELEEPLRYSDPHQDLYIDLPAGRQTLDGRGAQMFVRYRAGYAMGDLGRLDAQKRFLAAFFNSVKTNINARNAYAVAASLADKVETNIDLPMAIALGIEAMDVDGEDLLLCTLPGSPVTGKKSGASYYVMSARPTLSVLREYFGKSSDVIDEKRLFEHPENRDFIKVYSSDADAIILRADEIK